ncbi:hypothetical protein BRARA_H02511 [Brassica rapa]|uniref:RING-type domain-containing protein n=1 Tax=Brassica campestris TaxID=3711 RepID=A0A397YJ24_BRACM|nr:hypothetical protein BRARA_H02511 [Brassica rapa]
MAYEVYNCIEFYPTEVIFNPHPRIYAPVFRVQGRSFTRLLYRPIGRPDVLVRQFREDEIRYEHVVHLTAAAMQNQNNLFQGILASPPEEDVRVIPEDFLEIATWENVATLLSLSVENHNLNGVTPFRLEGHEAFGVVSIMREDEAWENEDCRDVPPPPLVVSECGVCLEDISQDPIHRLLHLHCCQHVFHKSCIYRTIWGAQPRCPTCRSVI